ncbi:cell division protein FtsA [Patescibacteria group bacterium]|nr:MAG: cell division protein FtsA [Patescibacteria group bacterium]
MSKHRNSHLIGGLDIGSSAVRMAVGQVVEKEDGEKELQILGAAEYGSEGVNKGKIESIEDAVSSISACLERCERMVGMPIVSVWVGVPSQHVLVQPSKGVVAVSKANSEIAEEDVQRALDAAKSIATPLNYEVLHVLPRSFGVDGQLALKDPVGMTGVRLEVDTSIVLGSSSQLKNLTKSVYRAGLEIDDLALSILAVAEAAATRRQKELGTAVVNIGGASTSLAVFEEGELLHTASVPLGSGNITNDIAIGLRTSVDIAERIKIEYGECVLEPLAKKEEIDLFDLGSEKHEIVKRKYLCEIVAARMEEILQKVDEQLRQVQRSGLLPAGVIFSGAGAKLAGLVEFSKRVLRLPSALGYPLGLMSVTDKVNDLGFATAIGMVKWGAQAAGEHSGGVSFLDKTMGRAGGKLKKWIKTLIP